MTTLGQVIGTIAALLFAMYFLETEKYTPKLHRVLKGFIIIVALSTISILLLDYTRGAIIGIVNVLVSTPLLLLTGILAWRAGNKAAKLYVIAWTVVLAGLATLVLVIVGQLPYNDLTRRASQVGVVIEVILLSLALADRINILRKQREQAQAAALASAQENERIIKEQNTLLEEKVDERTYELKQKQ